MSVFSSNRRESKYCAWGIGYTKTKKIDNPHHNPIQRLNMNHAKGKEGRAERVMVYQMRFCEQKSAPTQPCAMENTGNLTWFGNLVRIGTHYWIQKGNYMNQVVEYAPLNKKHGTFWSEKALCSIKVVVSFSFSPTIYSFQSTIMFPKELKMCFFPYITDIFRQYLQATGNALTRTVSFYDFPPGDCFWWDQHRGRPVQRWTQVSAVIAFLPRHFFFSKQCVSQPITVNRIYYYYFDL